MPYSMLLASLQVRAFSDLRFVHFPGGFIFFKGMCYGLSYIYIYIIICIYNYIHIYNTIESSCKTYSISTSCIPLASTTHEAGQFLCFFLEHHQGGQLEVGSCWIS